MNQRRMHRISPNNPVRRRLVFGENVEDVARVDNFANTFQENEAREMEEKSKKWGFDFKKEEPLDGPYEWFKKDGDNWIGMKVHRRVSVNGTDDDKISEMQNNNENTPVHVRDDTVPAVEKRRNNIEHQVIRTSVKRKVDFDADNLSLRRRRSDK